jgi:flagellar biosynthesis chaperone FliJ
MNTKSVENNNNSKEEKNMNMNNRNRREDAETLLKKLSVWKDCGNKAVTAPAWSKRYHTFLEEIYTTLTDERGVLDGNITIDGKTRQIDTPHLLEQSLQRLDNYKQNYETATAALHSLSKYQDDYMSFVDEIIGMPAHDDCCEDEDGDDGEEYPWDNCKTCEYRGNKEVCQACADYVDPEKVSEEEPENNIVQEALDPNCRINHLQNTQDEMSQHLCAIDEELEKHYHIIEELEKNRKAHMDLISKYGQLVVVDDSTDAVCKCDCVNIDDATQTPVNENVNLDSSPVTGRDMANTGDIIAENEIATIGDININIGGNVTIVEGNRNNTK